MRINYHHLFYFYTIARRGSIAAAGKELFLAQPTLSMQLKQLEKSLGRELFERVGKRLVLTPDGHEVLRYAESIFRLGQELEDSIRDTPAPDSRAVQFGVAAGIPKAFSHELLRTALRLAPGTHLECREAPLEDLLADLRDYRLDAVLSDAAAAHARGSFRNTLVGRVPVVFAARPAVARRLAARGPLPRAFEGAPMILPHAPAAVAREVRNFFAENNIQPERIAEVQDVETARRLALEGLGIAPMNLHSFSVSRPAKGLVVVGGRLPGIHQNLFFIEASDRLRQNSLVGLLRRGFRIADAASGK